MNASTNVPDSSTPSASAVVSNTKRAKALKLSGILVLLGLAYCGYAWYSGHYEESTDNAYVQGNVVQITPQVGGTVTAIFADDTDYVTAGQPLVQLDPADAKVALASAAANLAQTVRQVRALYANNTTLGAQITVRESDIARAKTELTRATDDFNRRQSLVGNGAVSMEDLNHAQSQVAAAQNALTTAQAGVSAAREHLNSNQTLTEGTRIDTHPSVQSAAVKVREAYLVLHRAALLAPVDGYVAKRSVQLGQRVGAGVSLMSIISLNQLWVDANFKEVQLRNIRIGQPVRLTADLYGKKVEYKGTVGGLGAGTGAAFALLPAQNATGNWIKVVQRVPVRVALEAKQVAEYPLRVGLSMEATVDITDQSGKALADGVRPASAVQTEVFALMDKVADDQVRKIITAHAGKSAH